MSASDEHDEKLAVLLSQMTDRVGRGEEVSVDEECSKHPELADELRMLWGAVVVATVAGSSADQRKSKAEPQQASRFQLPSRMGDFTLKEEVGRGGMGVVYRAYQDSLDREVALKMIRYDALSSAIERKRFVAEAQAAANLDHPGIVTVYGIGEQHETPYFCMRFIEGETLSERLNRGVLPPREAAKLMLQIARAIEYAHQQGVLHRDLKPSNILIDRDGIPHVSDFGLAKKVQEDSSLTRTGAVIGTPAYMSPEQATGRTAQVGQASDVYSLGAILYHMLCGRPPFQAASQMDTLLMVIEQDPVPPRMLVRDANRDLEMIALRCLQKPPDLRYESASALANDLDAFLNDEPVSVRSGRFAQIVASWFRETHHAPVLENWGLLWIWHSLVLFVACLLTNGLYIFNVQDRLYYFGLWTLGIGAWAAVFWALRRRMGPVTFVERQIAHIWASNLICVALLFPLEAWIGVSPLTLSPIVALVAGSGFMVKAGILSGSFYVQSGILFLTAPAMALWPTYAHLIFGVVAGLCFFVPGVKYYRVRKRNERVEDQLAPLAGEED